MVRLTSILHCSALQQVCELDEEKLQVLDLTELSQEHLRYLEEVPDRILVLVQWLQRLIVDSDAAGTICIPAPVLSRTFQELSRGVVNLQNLRKIKDIPFPYPYQQMLICMLFVHYLMTPVLASLLVDSMFWTATLCFFITGGFWAIVYIAAEIDQPFGDDPNDLPLIEMQQDFNQSLLVLLQDQTLSVPKYKPKRRHGHPSENEEEGFRIPLQRGASKVTGTSATSSSQSPSLATFMFSNGNRETDDAFTEAENNLLAMNLRKFRSVSGTSADLAEDLSRSQGFRQDILNMRPPSPSLSIPMAFRLSSVFRKAREVGSSVRSAPLPDTDQGNSYNSSADESNTSSSMTIEAHDDVDVLRLPSRQNEHVSDPDSPADTGSEPSSSRSLSLEQMMFGGAHVIGSREWKTRV